MHTNIKLIAILLCLPLYLPAQAFYQQYFDGWDSTMYAMYTIIDTSNNNNIWQIGPPQKTIFNAPSTIPNVIVTDTINHYPTNNISQFETRLALEPWCFGCIMAVQWIQKLDLEQGADGGILEYSLDSGATWVNTFDNPYVYSYYGFNPNNKDTLISGEVAFSGTDTLWKNIWLCFDNNYISSLTDTLYLRFTMQSDSVETNQEGWMIDNLYFNQTIIHTVKKTANEEQPYLKVYPTATSSRVHIEAEKLQEYHIIEQINLLTTDGRLVQTWGKSPTKFFIDIGHHSNGLYYLEIKTNKKTETHPIVLNP